MMSWNSGGFARPKYSSSHLCTRKRIGWEALCEELASNLNAISAPSETAAVSGPSGLPMVRLCVVFLAGNKVRGMGKGLSGVAEM